MPVLLNDNHPSRRGSFSYRQVSSGTGAQDPLVFPPGHKSSIAIILEILSGSSKVQASTSLVDDIMKGNNSNVAWVDWPKGLVSATIDDVCVPVSALRIFVQSGSSVLHIRGE